MLAEKQIFMLFEWEEDTIIPIDHAEKKGGYHSLNASLRI